jgi:molecular chaperone GrpE
MSSNQDPFASVDLLAAFDFAQASSAADNTHKREMESLLLGFIEVIDSLRTLEMHFGELATTTTARIPVRGTSLIVKNALKVIGDAGVTPMNCAGQPLDLLRHEVVEVRPAPGIAPDTILEEIQSGYLWRNRVLRLAKVAIAGDPE